MTPPDYKEVAREWCPDELDHAYHSDKHACVSIATALTQADAIGYARGLEEAANMVNDMADEADDRGNVKRRDFLFTIEDKFRAKARALTAEPAKEKP
jgi:hypothetical protein